MKQLFLITKRCFESTFDVTGEGRQQQNDMEGNFRWGLGVNYHNKIGETGSGHANKSMEGSWGGGSSTIGVLIC